MAGYDDISTIERIRKAMIDDPSLSRRAAIIVETGVDNLRRIEMKMRKEDTIKSATALPMDVINHFFGKGEATTVFGRVSSSEGTTACLSIGGNRVPLPMGSHRLQVGNDVACTYIGGRLAVVEDRATNRIHIGPLPPQPSLEMDFMVAACLAALIGIPIHILGGPILLALLPMALAAAWIVQGTVRTWRMACRLQALKNGIPMPAQ